MPKVSVIVPVYNAEKYLQECVDSILGQTLADLELILVDDGSTGSSPELCDSLIDCGTQPSICFPKQYAYCFYNYVHSWCASCDTKKLSI